MRCSPLLALLVWQALPGFRAEAQTTQPAVQAARSITAVDVARRIGVIADDSMLGRDTPSRGLELTAEYVAAQFRRFGLETSVQRFPITPPPLGAGAIPGGLFRQRPRRIGEL